MGGETMSPKLSLEGLVSNRVLRTRSKDFSLLKPFVPVSLHSLRP